ncbi:arsenosugar biosynthesis radical SAM (seleno)protein ArsS [Dehalogenimonas sp. THU2]|uniref:arsenosugar biosynthesis radical SAM (seleno)protein ArsS n=1 Tax=Dehalogenimonas sp. THU2 TaxID=3151121 RepID=UPI0032182182
MPKLDNSLSEKYDFGAWLDSRRLDLSPTGIDTLWLNITRLCNQACRHCHVNASPETPLHMSEDVINACLAALETNDQISKVDITGGAPELHPRFEHLVKTIRAAGKQVIVRHNLTVTIDGHPLSGEPKDHLPRFFAENNVQVLASLPHYSDIATDMVRGRGVFEKSIESLRRLAAAGYGITPGLSLKLVTNCDGPLSCAGRAALENGFRDSLARYGINFDDLLTVTNIPGGRYAETLRREDAYEAYMTSLFDSASETAARVAVCRSLVSVGIDGRLYDCDFNQAAGLPIGLGRPATIFDFDYNALLERKINFASHCFGCITGAGSG